MITNYVNLTTCYFVMSRGLPEE